MKYEVLSPYLAFRINENRQDYSLKKGDIVELPAAAPAVRAMLSRRQIKEVTTPAAPADTKRKKIKI